MCKICFEYIKGSLTLEEALKNAFETELVSDHLEEFFNLLDGDDSWDDEWD